jgi:hypothetical protein
MWGMEKARPKSSVLLASLLAGTLFAWTPMVRAQSCDGRNFDVEVALQKVWISCDDHMVYEVGAVAGERAVPALRKLAATVKVLNKKRRCGTLDEALQKTLAKLGDTASLQELALEFNRNGYVPPLAFVGDDHAIAIMMEYFAKHLHEPVVVNRGGLNGNDVPMHSPLWLIVNGIFLDIGERRSIPDSPFKTKSAWSDDEMKEAFHAWWEKHKNAPIAVPPYESVSDPYLRCLARKADWGLDWGFYGALLAISDRGGDEAKSVLEKFPDSDAKSMALTKLGSAIVP